LKFILRNDQTISQIRKISGDNQIFIADFDGLKYFNPNGSILKFHPSLAKIRITSLMKGNIDRLIKISEVKKGESVLDATAGIGVDALVFAFCVGEKGKVVSIESEKIPFIILKEGLTSYKSDVSEIQEAMNNIEVLNIDHLDYLKKLPDKSFDIIYFDPMFRKAESTVDLKPLRIIANNSPLKIESIIEAKRVARKKIILKENIISGEFERLGFKKVYRNRKEISYGVINC